MFLPPRTAGSTFWSLGMTASDDRRNISGTKMEVLKGEQTATHKMQISTIKEEIDVEVKNWFEACYGWRFLQSRYPLLPGAIAERTPQELLKCTQIKVSKNS